MNNIFIIEYNNYYNRIVKYEATLEGYINNNNIRHTLQNTNFNPNDNVNAEHVFGDANNAYDGTGDYALVVDTSGNIVSRWFIIESKRNRGGQWQLMLRRDVVAENFNKIIIMPCFIEKATIPSDNPLIWNSEGMTYNQIKKKETLLKDKTGIPWLVGYYDPSQTLSGEIERYDIEADFTISTELEQTDFYQYISSIDGRTITPTATIYGETYNKRFIFNFRDDGFSQYKYNLQLDAISRNYVGPSRNFVGINDFANSGQVSVVTIEENMPTMINRVPWANFTNYSNGLGFSRTTINIGGVEFYPYNIDGKIVNVSGKYYKIKIKTAPQRTSNYVNVSYQSNLYYAMRNYFAQVCEKSQDFMDTMFQSGTFIYEQVLPTYSIELTTEGINAQYSIDSFNKTTGAPYNLFAIPFGEVQIGNGSDSYKTKGGVALYLAQTLLKNHPNAIYDIQVLPYFPMQQWIKEEEGTVYIDIPASASRNIVKTTDEVPQIETVIIGVENVTFDVELPYSIIVYEKKIESECDMYRLCSPNWNGIFEFNASKNDGVSSFTANCTYKPIMPYIHVAPYFAGLYGGNYEDARGLVCGGDFSMSRITEQWQSYIENNRNFQLLQDRKIENMEIHHKYERVQDVVNAITGTLAGTLGGAITGGQFSSTGGVIGAIGGGIASGIAGAYDVSINQILRNEAIDYTKDMFEYQLGNIKAMPDTLKNVSAFNANNKIFPVLEYYSCSEQEKTALRNKLKYTGMTAMVVGTISDYVDNISGTGNQFIKGRLIRIEGLNEDTHVANTIASEINKGVYI